MGLGKLKTGVDLLHDPCLNKGTAFTYEERVRLKILGLLPPRVSRMRNQVERVRGNIRSRTSGLNRYIEMVSLLDRNETLFYKVLRDNLQELMPVVYTPVVGTACQLYAHIFRRSRGLFITPDEKGKVKDILRHWPRRDVRVVVVTDGERILGLGDLGANGMGIPVGKLCLYTACGGIPPDWALPVTLDVGTDNEDLLKDPLYLGIPRRRLRGRLYDELIDEFVGAARELFPKALIQFEDFANRNAFRFLEKYRRVARVFNDDIQGTAAVTLAGLVSACRLLHDRLSEQKILFHGAGEAAVGIADLIVRAMMEEGMSKEEAVRRCWFMDSKGLVESGRQDLPAHKRPYAHDHRPLGSLLEAIQTLKPTALIGVSGRPGQFTRPVVKSMSRLNARPIIFALSNPTSNAECTAEQAYEWSDGRAIFAAGSPFAPVTRRGKTFVPGQSNNAYVFPGVGLGAIFCQAERLTDEMFLAAARALAACLTEEESKKGLLYPPLSDIFDVSARIAAAVAETAYAQGLAARPRPKNLLARIRESQYQPVYPEYA